MKIIIVQHNWPLQSFTSQLIEACAEKFEVVLYIDKHSLLNGLIDNSIFQRTSAKIQYSDLRISSIFLRRNKIVNYIISLMLRKLAIAKKIELFIAGKKLRKIHKKSDIVLAVEKEAFIVASRIRERESLFYYSLELYFEGHSGNPGYKYVRRTEKKLVNDLRHLIIQDDIRKEIFLERNGVKTKDSLKTILLPVSVLPRKTPVNNTRLWHKKFNLDEDTRIVLYFGLIKKKVRGLEQFISGMKEKKSDFALIVHGYGDSKLVASLRTLAEGLPVYFSTDLIPDCEVPNLIDSSDIGLTWYSCEDENNCHTAFSSEKIALFLRSGKPILANDSPTYKKLFSSYGCGLSERDPAQMDQLVKRILNNYSSMSTESLGAYSEFYNFKKNSLELLAHF